MKNQNKCLLFSHLFLADFHWKKISLAAPHDSSHNFIAQSRYLTIRYRSLLFSAPCILILSHFGKSMSAFCTFVSLGSVQLSSPWAVVQLRFQASFISHGGDCGGLEGGRLGGVAAFLIFQTNSYVSIAACQFWFCDSFIIKGVRLQCRATDGLLHFSHGRGTAACVREEKADVRSNMCACFHPAEDAFLACLII